MNQDPFANPNQFRNKSWGERYTAMGDQAETAYEADRERRGIAFVRSGLNRPPFKQVWRLPLVERYRPDYMELDRYVEVQGYGQDQRTKLKVEKLEQLGRWANIMPVVLFLFDSTSNSSIEVPLKQIQLLVKGRATKQFPEGKEYYEIHADELRMKVAA